MNPEMASTKLLDYGAVGCMLVLAVCALVWMAREFRKTTESHLASVIGITDRHSQQIEELQHRYQVAIDSIICEFKSERELMNAQSAKEREAFTTAYRGNTDALRELWLVVEKRHSMGRQVRQQLRY